MASPSTSPWEQAYSTDADGDAPVAIEMRISGELGPAYVDFVAERAAWLSVAGWIERSSESEARAMVWGAEALVGALEMACTLGPIDSLVHSIAVGESAEPAPAGFIVRR